MMMRNDEGGKMQEKETLDERLPGLFEPDTLLPIQYFEAMRRKHLLEGEKRLVLSVLEDAVECFMKCIDSPTSKGQRLYRDADEWINLEDKHWVFSFDNVCDMLDINPEYMRRGLKGWKERKLAAIQHAAEARAAAAAAELGADGVDQTANSAGENRPTLAAAQSTPPINQSSGRPNAFPTRPADRKTGSLASARQASQALRKVRA
jgi:imidazolonepropionase-like amidohydrolase